MVLKQPKQPLYGVAMSSPGFPVIWYNVKQVLLHLDRLIKIHE